MCDHCGCRTFAPIADLTADHERILALAWQVAEGDPAGHAELLALLDRHVVKEETGLYPLLMQNGRLSTDGNTALLAGRLADRLGGMEDEHVALHAALADPAFDRRAYYALAAHIEDEEMELFPLAMLSFDEDDWAAADAVATAVTAGVACTPG